MARRYSVPGLDKYPDLQRRFDYDMERAARTSRCARNCDGSAVTAKYSKLVRQRLDSERPAR